MGTIVSIICSALAQILCGWVIFSYLRYPAKRKAPGGLMLSKTISDFIIAFIFMLMLSYKDDNTTTQCTIFCCVWCICFITSNGYLCFICWDLFRTLTNPFRKPSSGSLKMHFILWISAAIPVFIIAGFNIFVYRPDLGFCFTCNTGELVNPYNLILFYMPLITAIFSGIFVLIYSIKRLTKGLHKTFELRRTVITRQISWPITHFIVGIIWIYAIYNTDCPIQVQSEDANLCLDETSSNSCSKSKTAVSKILYMIMFLVIASGDALAWFIGNRLIKKSTYITLKSISIVREKKRKKQEMLLEHEHKQDISNPNQEIEQNLSNALRGEVIEYITVGLEQSLRTIATHTHHNTNSQNIDDIKDIDNILNIREPEPQITDYPHINEINVSLPNKNKNNDNDIELQQMNDKKSKIGKLTNKILKSNAHKVFKSYAPHVFRYLRQEIYNIDDNEYILSIQAPIYKMKETTELISSSFSEGRSGAFFFFTHDNKYIIKTVTKIEGDLLLKILPSFVLYYSNNPRSLINKFFGLYSIKMYNLTIYFVVLANIFVVGNRVIEPHEKYDLKGSYVDRHTNNSVESRKLMKDEDFHKIIKINQIESDRVYKQLELDTQFLLKQNIMDYSVLLGIYYVAINPEYIDNNNNKIISSNNNNHNNYVAPSMDPDNIPTYNASMKQFLQNNQALKANVIEGPGVYYLGIIDVLQEWNSIKKIERLFKVYLRCKNGKGISCVEPNFYRNRFLDKMSKIGITTK